MSFQQWSFSPVLIIALLDCIKRKFNLLIISHTVKLFKEEKVKLCRELSSKIDVSMTWSDKNTYQIESDINVNPFEKFL